jgi:hypothetical protein
MKEGVRIAAVTSGPIKKGVEAKLRNTQIVAVIGSKKGIEGILSSKVSVDGSDSTKKIISMIKRSRFREQVKAIALNGIAIAGLNVVDIEELNRKLRCQTILLTRKRPRRSLLIQSIRNACINTEEKARKISMLKKQGDIRKVGGFYIQAYPDTDVKNVLNASAELLRLSHMIASGISKGESMGRI